MVTWDNYEEYLLLYVDEELGEHEREALMKFISVHPELQDELAAYQTTRLSPVLTEVYNNKEALLKPLPQPRIIDLRQWWMYGAAAGILIIVFVMTAQWNAESETAVVARQEVPRQQQSIRTNDNPAPVTVKPVTHEKHSSSLANTGVRSNTEVFVGKAAAIEKIEIAAMKPVTHENSPTVAAGELIEVPDAANLDGEANIPETRKGFFARLPVKYESKEGLRNLKENVETRLEEVKNIADQIKDTELAFRVGNKELFVINF